MVLKQRFTKSWAMQPATLLTISRIRFNISNNTSLPCHTKMEELLTCLLQNLVSSFIQASIFQTILKGRVVYLTSIVKVLPWKHKLILTLSVWTRITNQPRSMPKENVTFLSVSHAMFMIKTLTIFHQNHQSINIVPHSVSGGMLKSERMRNNTLYKLL
jgi:hypothetical protein